jgi:O-antigen/teichoic acid export membrane protein
MSQVFTRIGVIALTLLVSEHAAGIYAAGLKLVEMACLPLLFLGRAAYPGLSRAFREPREFRRMGRHALAWGFAIAALSAIALAIATPSLLVPMLGPGFAGSEPMLMAMAALMFVQGIEIVLGRLLLSANLNCRTRRVDEHRCGHMCRADAGDDSATTASRQSLLPWSCRICWSMR